MLDFMLPNQRQLGLLALLASGARARPRPSVLGQEHAQSALKFWRAAVGGVGCSEVSDVVGW